MPTTSQPPSRFSGTKAEVDQVVQETFLGAMSEQDNNLQFVRDMLTKRAPDTLENEVLETYRQIRRGKRPVPDEEQSLVKSHLKLSGVVCRTNDALRVRNTIYREVFNAQWIRKHLPESLWQRLKPAMPLIMGLSFIALVTGASALYATQQAQIAKVERQKAQVQSKEADRQRQEADRQRQEADKQRNIALKQTELAQKERQNALRQRDIAQKQQKIALSQAKIAVQQRREADKQRLFALQQRNLAEGQKKAADAAKGIAEQRQREAENARQAEKQQRDQAIAAKQEAQKNEKEALAQKGNAEVVATSLNSANLMVSGLQLEALMEGVRAGQQLKALGQDAFPKTSAQTAATLQQTLAKMEEHNRLEGHSGAVMSVSFSPDGQTLATGSADKTVKLWSRDGQLLKTLEGHSGSVRSVSFSPDGQTLATGNAENTVKLWSRDGQLLKTLEGYSSWVNSVSFSPDGQTLATGSFDNTVKLWNFNLEKLLAQGCHWLADYLKNNPKGQQHQSLCNGVAQPNLQPSHPSQAPSSPTSLWQSLRNTIITFFAQPDSRKSFSKSDRASRS